MADRYPSLGDDPREYRTRAANRTAAIAMIAAIILVIAILAVLG